jgi:prephenate dehydrogenase
VGVDAPPFERLGIVGLGLIGGSVALAAKRRWPSLRIAACDPAPIVSEAVSQGLVEAVVPSVEDLSNSDLIVIATPVQVVPEIVSRLARAGTSALVTDTGSTKRAVMAAAGTTSSLLFVGGHPVAGAGVSGLAAARADLFDGRPWLLVSSRDGGPEDVREAMLATFVVGLGATPEWTDAVTHDRVMAHVSQAPQVLTASTASDVWRGILDTNADFIADALMAIAAKLPTSSQALTDAPAVQDVLERARALRAKQ